MEIKSELDIFLERELLKAVSLYGAKTGASGVGEFILEAIDFDLESEGEAPLDRAESSVKNAGIIIGKDTDNNRIITYKVQFEFRGQAHKAVTALAARNGGIDDIAWLMKVLDGYAQSIDRRTAAEKTLSGGIIQPEASRP
jgi:hypothetical protein